MFLQDNAENFAMAERAFVNSILSEAVYTDQLWLLASSNEREIDIPELYKTRHAVAKDKDFLAKALFLRKIGTPLTQTDLQLPFRSNLYNGKDGYFDSGVWQGGKIGGAAAIHTVTNGKSCIHLLFRGTDTNSSGNTIINYWRNIAGYGLSAYSEIQEHFLLFEPLIQTIVQYVNNPKNNIDELHIAGHSLGGAMVQEFLHRHPARRFKRNLKVFGFTYGSPGSGTKSRLERLLFPLHNILSSFKNYKVKAAPRDIAVIENRQYDLYHHRDPIAVTLGPLLYSSYGKQIPLRFLNEDIEERGFAQVKFHSIKSYILLCEEACYTIAADNPEISTETSAIRKFQIARQKAYKMIMRAPEKTGHTLDLDFIAYKEFLRQWGHHSTQSPIAQRQEIVMQEKIKEIKALPETALKEPEKPLPFHYQLNRFKKKFLAERSAILSKIETTKNYS